MAEMGFPDRDDPSDLRATPVASETFADAVAAKASQVFALLPADIAAELSRLTADALALDPHVSEVVARARPRAERAESGEETASGRADEMPDAADDPQQRHG